MPPLPDFALIHQERQRKGVTLMLLWQEYKSQHPSGLQYSQFCDLYNRWRGRQDVVLRQNHAPGDKLFLDYAGTTIEVIDRFTGEIRTAQVFVAVLGASSYTYAEATWTQSLPDWLGSQRRALEFFGGVPAALVPDNLKSAVTKAQRYEPDLNPSYQEFAAHYGVAILPARVRKPRDKAKVEVGVQVVERWIVARLRHQSFFSLAELNAQIRDLLADLNQRPFRKRDGCRASLFAELDQPALKPLPTHGYEFGQWKQAKVHLDYHIEVDHHYYSVPHTWVGQRVDVRVSLQAIEIFHKNQRIAVHRRSAKRGAFTTTPEHRPPRHQGVVNLDHERLLRQAEAIGPNTVAVLRAQVLRRLHPEQCIRSGLGILRLSRDYSPAALESACARALGIQSVSYRSIRLLLQSPAPEPAAPLPVQEHDNLRGAAYFQEGAPC
jgi:transposase